MRLLVVAVLLVAALFMIAASAVPAPAGSTIRVALIENARAVEVRGDDIQLSAIAGCPRCRAPLSLAGGEAVRAVPRDGGVEIDGASFGRGARLRSERAIRLNGREYAGTLEILKNGEGLVVVNEVPFEEYVAGVLMAEMLRAHS